MTELVTTGAIFTVEDRFSVEIERLIRGISDASESTVVLQKELAKLGLVGVVPRVERQFAELKGIAERGVAGIAAEFDTLGLKTAPGLAGINAEADRAFAGVVGAARGVPTEIAEQMSRLRAVTAPEFAGMSEAATAAYGKVVEGAGGIPAEVATRLAGIGEATAPAFAGIPEAARGAFASVVEEAVGLKGEIAKALGGLDEASTVAFAGIPNAARAAGAEAVAAIKASLAEISAMRADVNIAAGASALSGSARVPKAVENEALGLGMGGRTHGRGGGLHFGRVGTETPGGHVSLGGTPALAAAGVIGYGVFEAATMRDEIARLMLTGQVKPEDYGTTSEVMKELLQNAASTTGFSVGQVGEALSKSERAMAGLDVGTKLSVTRELLPYAAGEARLKETSLAESLETMVGLAHMTGTYEPDKLRDLARKFSFVSLATNATLPQFERTLSYSMPILRTGMGMDPDTIMALTAVSQNAGITSSKSGTWLRSFFESSEPAVGDSKAAREHNDALRDMGLLDAQNRVTWKVNGPDGKTDWNASVAKEGGIIAEHMKGVPIDERMGTVKGIWGERGGAMASMLSMNTFVEQFVTLADKINRFQGGSEAIEEYTKNSPLQKGRETWRDFQNILIDIGDQALPTVNTGLTLLDKVLKQLPADWEQTKEMWAPRIENIKELTTGKRPDLTPAGAALPDLAKQGALDFMLGRVPGQTSGSVWESIWDRINPVGAAHGAELPARPAINLRGGAQAFHPAAEDRLDRARSSGIDFSRPMSGFHPDDDRLTRARSSEFDKMLEELLRKQRESGWQLGKLNDTTGVLHVSFTGLNTGSEVLSGKFGDLGGGASGLNKALDTLTQTAMGAASALASVALGGGGRSAFGASGILNASYEGGAISGSSSAPRNMRYGAGGHSHGGNFGGSIGSIPGDNDFKNITDSSGLDWHHMGVQMNRKRAYLGQHLLDIGATRFAAAGMLGNSNAESNFKTDAFNPRLEKSHGLFQWNEAAGRWSPMVNWANSHGRNPYDPLAQLDYAKVEASHMQMRDGSGRSVWQAMQQAHSAREASDIWIHNWEKPSVEDRANRGALSEQALRAIDAARSVPKVIAPPPRAASPAPSQPHWWAIRRRSHDYGAEHAAAGSRAPRHCYAGWQKGGAKHHSADGRRDGVPERRRRAGHLWLLVRAGHAAERRGMSAPSIEPLVAAIAKLVDREVKRHGYDAMQVCGALGATAGAIVGVNLPDARFDPFMLGALGMGFQEVVTGARKKAAN